MDNLILNSRGGEAPVTPGPQSLANKLTRTLRTIWGFTGEQGESVFLAIDYREKAVASFLGHQRRLAFPQHLIEQAPLDPEGPFESVEQKVQALQNFLSHDLEALAGEFKRLGLKVPTRVWAGIIISQEKPRIVFDYFFGETTEELPFSQALSAWQRDLVSRKFSAVTIHGV